MPDNTQTTNPSSPNDPAVWTAVSDTMQQRAESNSTPTYRALIVDDEPVVRKSIRLFLDDEDFVCDTAADGNEALNKVAANKFDLVVTDLKMPNKNGHALVVELLKSAERPIIVVLTALDNPRMAKDLMLRGVDDVMFKPVNHETFAAKVRGLVRRRSTSS